MSAQFPHLTQRTTPFSFLLIAVLTIPILLLVGSIVEVLDVSGEEDSIVHLFYVISLECFCFGLSKIRKNHNVPQN